MFLGFHTTEKYFTKIRYWKFEILRLFCHRIVCQDSKVFPGDFTYCDSSDYLKTFVSHEIYDDLVICVVSKFTHTIYYKPINIILSLRKSREQKI